MEELRVSPRLFTESGNWVRFTKYEIKEVEAELYIKPAEGSQMEVYNPYEKSPSILLDLIKMADSLKNHENDCDRAKDILKFVNKYGLLGMFSLWVHSFPTWFKRDVEQYILNLEKQQKIIEQLNKEKPIEELEKLSAQLEEFTKKEEENKPYERFALLRQGNPFSNKLLEKYTPESDFIDCNEWEYDKYASIFFPNMKAPYPRHDGDTFLFWQNYHEPIYAYVHLLLVAYRSVYVWALDIDEFDKGKFSLNDWYGHDKHFRGLYHQSLEERHPAKSTWGCMLDSTIFTEGINIKLKLDDDGNKKIEYSTFSLYDDICLMFIEDKVSNKQLLKRCNNEKCNQWFLAKSPKAQFCSTACGTSVRVDRFRNKSGQNGHTK